MSTKNNKYIHYEGESLEEVLDYANNRTQHFKILTVFPVPENRDPFGGTAISYVVVLERLPQKK